MKLQIHPSQLSDIEGMVLLSKAKRLAYEQVQPQFWRYAGAGGDDAQRQWFKNLMEDEAYVMFTASSSAPICAKASLDKKTAFSKEGGDQVILGFIIGKLIPAPAVYNPGGLTVMVDDFVLVPNRDSMDEDCMRAESLWQSVGAALMDALQAAAKVRGASQMVVVCGAHDDLKRQFLMSYNLSLASEWFVGGII